MPLVTGSWIKSDLLRVAGACPVSGGFTNRARAVAEARAEDLR